MECVPEFLSYLVREQYADRRAALCFTLRLIEDEGIVVAKFAFCKSGGIAGAQTAPAQQFEVCANSTRIGGLAIPLLTTAVVVVGGFNERIVLFATKGQSLILLARHLVDSFGRILLDPSLFFIQFSFSFV